MLHNVDMCGVGHYATPSNGVGFVWIAFLMPYGGSWPRFGLD